jgi:hypothetical protein
VAADTRRLELRAEIGDHLRADLTHGQRAETWLDVAHEHARVANAGPVGEIRDRVLGPPLPGEVPQRPLALLVECELAHRLAQLQVGRERLHLLLARPARKGLLTPRRAAACQVPAQPVAAVGELLDLQAASPLSIASSSPAKPLAPSRRSATRCGSWIGESARQHIRAGKLPSLDESIHQGPRTAELVRSVGRSEVARAACALHSVRVCTGGPPGCLLDAPGLADAARAGSAFTGSMLTPSRRCLPPYRRCSFIA